MSLPKFPDAETRHKKLVYIKNNWQLYVFFALPAVLLTFIFKYIPMGGLAIAFEDYNNRLGIFGSEWIWFENFQRFLSSTEFPRLMANTLKLSVYGLLWGFFPPIILAILLSRVRRVGIRKKIQLLIYAPNFISVIVLAGMIIAFLSPVGPINAALGTQSNLMTDPAAFRPIYIISGIWQGAGWASIIYTAALSGVSGDLVDACNIDGASLLQQIWNVDIPTLKPIMVIRSILVQNTPRPGMVADAQNAAMMAKIAEQLKYSTIVVSSVPLLVMYPFFQKYFEKGVMLGSVKG